MHIHSTIPDCVLDKHWIKCGTVPFIVCSLVFIGCLTLQKSISCQRQTETCFWSKTLETWVMTNNWPWGLSHWHDIYVPDMYTCLSFVVLLCKFWYSDGWIFTTDKSDQFPPNLHNLGVFWANCIKKKHPIWAKLGIFLTKWLLMGTKTGIYDPTPANEALCGKISFWVMD